MAVCYETDEVYELHHAFPQGGGHDDAQAFVHYAIEHRELASRVPVGLNRSRCVPSSVWPALLDGLLEETQLLTRAFLQFGVFLVTHLHKVEHGNTLQACCFRCGVYQLCSGNSVWQLHVLSSPVTH